MWQPNTPVFTVFGPPWVSFTDRIQVLTVSLLSNYPTSHCYGWISSLQALTKAGRPSSLIWSIEDLLITSMSYFPLRLCSMPHGFFQAALSYLSSHRPDVGTELLWWQSQCIQKTNWDGQACVLGSFSGSSLLWPVPITPHVDLQKRLPYSSTLVTTYPTESLWNASREVVIQSQSMNFHSPLAFMVISYVIKMLIKSWMLSHPTIYKTYVKLPTQSTPLNPIANNPNYSHSQSALGALDGTHIQAPPFFCWLILLLQPQRRGLTKVLVATTFDMHFCLHP